MAARYARKGSDAKPGDAGPRARAGRIDVAGVAISHPERVLFPAIPLTKLGLARYYEDVAEWMLPHVARRPLTLLHGQEGVTGPTAFLRHAKAWGPSVLERVRIPEKHKLGEYLVVNDAPGLVALAQMDVLEIHTWNSTADAVEQPNRLVIDLDPGPAVPWRSVVVAARRLRGVLSALGLESFVKTTGGCGLHVVVPLEPAHDWRECLAVARGVAGALARDDPATFTTALPKAGREHQVLLDYLRNNRTNTSIAAFSTRADERASVSVPLAWDELTALPSSARYDVRSVRRRLARLRRDPWEAYWSARQRIPAGAVEALAAL